MTKYLIVDSNALLHRGFHAMPDLATSKGEYTGAMYGFVSILLRAIDDIKPDFVLCSFDLPGGTFRNDLYKEYKATRTKAPQELYDQIPKSKDIVRAMGAEVVEMAGFESDDCIGTLCQIIKKREQGEYKIFIATGDMDTLQLVDEYTEVHTLRKGISDNQVFDTKSVKEKYGLLPHQLIDYKALRGDPSDNIKGVKGIGEKTASELLQAYETLEGLYAELDNPLSEIRARTRELLLKDRESAFLSKTLATIKLDVPINPEFNSFVLNDDRKRELIGVFEKYEFHSLIRKITNGKAAVQKKQALESDLRYEYKKIGLEELRSVLKDKKSVAVYVNNDEVFLSSDKAFVYSIDRKDLSDDELKNIFSKDLFVYDSKSFYKKVSSLKMDFKIVDLSVMAYLLDERVIGKDLLSVLMVFDVDMANIQIQNEGVFTVLATMYLANILPKKINDLGLSSVYNNIDGHLPLALSYIEDNGVLLDLKLLDQVRTDAEIAIGVLEKDIHTLCGVDFNIASPKQMSEVLFEKLKLNPVDNKKNKTGYSTAASELEKIKDQHPVVGKIMEYRELAKLKNTYLDVLPDKVDRRSGRLHTTYSQISTSTGRVSSHDPNLQNIPASSTGFAPMIRQSFIADEGNVLLSLDYSQIELRIAAHLASDANMIKIFKDGKDIHADTAKAMFQVEEVTSDQRRDAKTINFGILYGVSGYGLAARTEMSGFEARQYIDKYFTTFPGVKNFLDKIRSDVKKDGYIRSESGRIRRFNGIRSPVFALRNAAERAAINFPIQSLAADCIKIATIKVYDLIKNDPDIKMILQVHDELVFEIKKEKLEDYAGKIKALMESALSISVPLEVSVKSGKNWKDMQKTHLQ